jgi:dTDP-4-amino-4,6-dideoxygalactose transaminase
VTDDEELATHARYLFHQAKDDAIRYVHGEVGFNYAMSNVAAAIGVGQMERLPAYIATKRANRARYAEALRDVDGITFLAAPAGTNPNCWFYTILVEPDVYGMDREALMQRLSEMGIQSRPLWLPIHMQKPYSACPVIGPERAVWYWERALNLPCSSNLTPDDVERVTTAIRSLARS